MLFNSPTFVFVFLPIVLIVFLKLTKFQLIRLAKLWLIFASLVFYAYWNIRYLVLLIISIFINHLISQWILNLESKKQLSKTFLFIGICFNLGLLGYYKYANFFADSINQLKLLSVNLFFGEIVLPLAISFYTFTQIAYLVDVYKKEASRSSLLNYTLFVLFFPQLIAGPILRNRDFIPQLLNPDTFLFSHKNFAFGVTFFTLGLAKKVLIADNLSSTVASVFDRSQSIDFSQAWIGSLAYTFQIYFDFSGYSDMAIGLGLLFNIRLPINFNSPYKATSIVDFWRRWHITLSNFLRDYIYIPLGGNRYGEARQYSNIIIAMLLGGLWHGANWTFVVWGGLHGVFLTIAHWWRKHGVPIPGYFSWILTFSTLVVSWIFFRASSLQDASEIFRAMVNINGQDFARNSVDMTSLAVVSLIPIVIFLPNTQQIVDRLQPNKWIALFVAFLLATSIYSIVLSNRSEFLYFQF